MNLAFLKVLLSLTLLLYSLYSSSQQFLVNLKVKKIVYYDDSLVNDIAIEYEITTDKTTDIISIGEIGITEIGIKLEILESEMDSLAQFIMAKAYYQKENGKEWKKIGNFNHSRIKVSSIGSRVENEMKRQERIKNAPTAALRKMFSQIDSNSFGDPPYFTIEYLLFVYRN